jgi:hypothetical protein
VDPETIQECADDIFRLRAASLALAPLAGAVSGICRAASLCALFALAPTVLAAQSSADGEPWSSDNISFLLQEPGPMIAPPQESEPAFGPSFGAGPPVTVHGVVLNAATGLPLPRALVKLDSAEGVGALTGSEGQFEIPGVPSGLQIFSVVKPGYSGPGAGSERGGSAEHSVRVAPNMPDQAFSLAPENALYGHVSLSTGDPAVGIGVTLLRLTVENGRASWVQADSHQTTPEGAYRFSGLGDGTYTVMTEPAFDNENATAPACNGPVPQDVKGYAISYLGDAADLGGAARIQLAGGQAGQADLALTLGSYHAVQVALSRPVAGSQWQFTSTLLDRNGQSLGYPLNQNGGTHAVCAYLPDGAYTLAMVGSPEREQPRGKSTDIAGLLDFAVEGHAQTHLRIPLAPGVSTPIHVRYEPSRPAARQPEISGREEDGSDEAEPLGILFTRANGIIGRGETGPAASKKDADLDEVDMAPPGAYWMHGTAEATGVCLGEVTAGGENLARTPWIAGTGGTGPPIEVVLRTDCSKLNMQLPAGVLAESAGEMPALFVYVVPEFDSIADIRDLTADPSDSPTLTAEDLTPGAYRVFIFPTRQDLEYRNPAAMRRIADKGQPVTLSPGATTNLVLELPTR